MTEVQISPLAKRLAEENSIDWRKIRGTGPEGRVIERDILTYLARIMSGEADLPAEPDKSEPAGPSSMPAAVPGNVANFAAASAGLAKEGVDLSALIGGFPAVAATSIYQTPPPPLDFGSLELSAPEVPVVAPPVVVSPLVSRSFSEEPVFEIDFDDLTDDEPEIVFENPTVEAVIPEPAWTAPEPVVPAWTAPEPVIPAWTAPVIPEPVIPEPIVPAWTAPMIPEPVVPAWTAPEPAVLEPVVPAWTAPVIPEPVMPAWTAPEPVVVPEPVWTPAAKIEPALPVWTAPVIPQPVIVPEPVWIMPEAATPEPVLPAIPVWTMPEPVAVPEPIFVPVPEHVVMPAPILEPVIPESVFVAPEPVFVAPEPTFVAPPAFEPVVVPVPEPVVVPEEFAPIAVVVAPLAAPSSFSMPSSGVLNDFFQLFVARREFNPQPLEAIRGQLSLSLNNREIPSELFLARAVGRALHLLETEQFTLARLESSGLQAYQVVGFQHGFLEALQGLSRATQGTANGLLVVDASRLGVDDLVLPNALGVLALGRHGKLTLSGNLPPLQSTEFLHKVAELLENPVGLVV